MVDGEIACDCLASKAGDRETGSTMLILTLFATVGFFLRLLVKAFKMFFLKFCLEALSYLLGEVLFEFIVFCYSSCCIGLTVAHFLFGDSLAYGLFGSIASLRSLLSCFFDSWSGVLNALAFS